MFQAHFNPGVHLACAKLLALAFDHPPLHEQLLNSVAPSLLCKLVATYAAAEHPVDVVLTDTPQNLQLTCVANHGAAQVHGDVQSGALVPLMPIGGDASIPPGASTWLDAFLLQPLVPDDAHQRRCTEMPQETSTPAAAAAQRVRSTARDGALTASVALMVALRETDVADTLCALGYAKHLHALLCSTKDPPLHVAALQSLASMIAAAPPDAAHQLLAHGGLPTLLQLAEHGSGRCLGLGIRAGAVECLALLAGHHHADITKPVDGALHQVVPALRWCIRSRDAGCQAAALAVLAAVAARSTALPMLFKVGSRGRMCYVERDCVLSKMIHFMLRDPCVLRDIGRSIHYWCRSNDEHYSRALLPPFRPVAACNPLPQANHNPPQEHSQRAIAHQAHQPRRLASPALCT